MTGRVTDPLNGKTMVAAECQRGPTSAIEAGTDSTVGINSKVETKSTVGTEVLTGVTTIRRVKTSMAVRGVAVHATPKVQIRGRVATKVTWVGKAETNSRLITIRAARVIRTRATAVQEESRESSRLT